MSEMKKKDKVKELRTKAKKFAKDYRKIMQDSEVQEKAEEFNREISRLSPKDLLEQFTI